MTPLMQQYWQIKSAHEDKVVLFRMGDFFEMFHQDAELAAPILGIALTCRNKKANDETKMCGVPHHSIAGHIAKLLAAGHKVAICDQIEDPATAKGLVKRAVTRILTPGMVYDPATLDHLEGHFISAFDDEAVSFIEPTTGEAFFYRTRIESERERLWQLLRPKELVVTGQQRQSLPEAVLAASHMSVVDSEMTSSAIPISAQRLLDYCVRLQGPDIARTIPEWRERRLNQYLELSPTVIRHLEILQSYRGEKRGTLAHAMDCTKSAAGGRLLRQWLQFPLTDLAEINQRLDQVEHWTKNPQGLKAVRDVLATMGDIERRLGKIANPGCNARDILALAQSLRAGLTVAPLCQAFAGETEFLKSAEALALRIEAELVEDPPLTTRQGGVFRRGVLSSLDELIVLTEDVQNLLNELETREREATGIPSLKVRYNNVFGYYLELTKTHAAKAPPHYRRKQTLANAERYTTPELEGLEDRVLSAHSRRSELEYELFAQLRESVLRLSGDLIYLARCWSALDVETSLAWLAIEHEYVRPKFGSLQVHLEASRHPVVEQEVASPFTPNLVTLKRGECLLLTGPNMAGKSTLMRQVALTVIMAQMGSFVPARQAELPVFTGVFTRIGASDYLAQGLSTFMVEMSETAEILARVNEKSLVILDEIGRGTSTYDGLSLAQAILEYLVSMKRPVVLFATHYHELTRLASHYPQIQNAHMAIHEKSGEITFLHTLTPGPANKSYGIQVARLAGLPAAVTQRAKGLLAKLEGGMASDVAQLNLSAVIPADAPVMPTHELEELAEAVRTAPLQKMTPLDALNQIAQWQRSLS